MQVEAMKKINEFNIWTGGKHNKEHALPFWGKVFEWLDENGEVVKASSRDEQVARLGLVMEFLGGLSYDSQGVAAKRLYLDRDTYGKYKKEAKRFFGLLQDEAQKKKLFWWWVVARTGHKGFGWGPEVPEGDHIIYGQTPQAQAQPTEREEEDTPHCPPNSDEPPL